MFWFPFFHHAFIFCLLLFFTRAGTYQRIPAEERLFLLYHFSLLLFCDILRVLPSDLTIGFLREDNIDDVFHVFCYLITGFVLMWGSYRSIKRNAKIVFFLAGLLFFWFAFEELNYGVVYLRLGVHGPIHRAFLEVHSVDDWAAVSPLGIVLKLTWTVLVLALMVTVVALVISPDISLTFYKSVRWCLLEFKTYYFAQNGFLFLSNRAMVLFYFLFGRSLLWEGILPYDSEIEQTALSILCLFYSILYLLPKMRKNDPVFLMKKTMNFLFPATLVWLIVWIGCHIYVLISDVPVRPVSADFSKSCAESLTLHHFRGYKVGSNLVVRGMLGNHAKTDADYVFIRYSFLEETGKTISEKYRPMFPLDYEVPAKSGFNTYIKNEFGEESTPSLILVSVASCRSFTKTSQLMGLGK